MFTSGLQSDAHNTGWSLETVASQIDHHLRMCSFLDSTHPGQVAYPQDAVYEFEESRYWSAQQASASPICRFSPANAVGVSFAVLTVQVSGCKFAVKSGGHAAFRGASNIDEGLTIDLINLNQITVSMDRTETAVGSGNRWHDVYSALQPQGLSVVGGRVSAIGVGGLITGGGISFFSGRYGWACDNVNSYEVVFADGSVQEVTYSNYPDLYFALRGGGNNFGIVTRFDLVTFPQGDLWAGSETYLYSNRTSESLNDALSWLNINAPTDNYAQVILAYAYVQSLDTYIIASDLQYGKPAANPPILHNFTATPGAVASTLRVTNLTGLVAEFNDSNPGGFRHVSCRLSDGYRVLTCTRQTYWTLMIKNSPTLMSQIVSIFMEDSKPVKDAADIVPSITFQPIPLDMISHFTKNGGNALGITTADGPLIRTHAQPSCGNVLTMVPVFNLVYSWSSASDDSRILAAARSIISRSNSTAYTRGLGHAFIYQNYAALEQPVLQSYGRQNLARLQAVSRKYDPKGVWQKLQPGYFKLF
ncbi:FAD binding domain-containing protein [Diplocarpon rosae]|nr:FAD binding domain-containing protein [Diplocarpon rosae]